MKKKKLIKDIQRVILPENLVEEANNTCDTKLMDLNIITPLFYARVLYLLNKKCDVISFKYMLFSRDKLQIILNMPHPHYPDFDKDITMQLDSKNLILFDTEHVLNKAQIVEYEPVIRNIINTAYLSSTNDILMIFSVCDALLKIDQRNYKYNVRYELFNIKPSMNKVEIMIPDIGFVVITNRESYIVNAKEGTEPKILSEIKNSIDDILLEISPFFKNERKKYRKMTDAKTKDLAVNKNNENEKIYEEASFIIDWFERYIEGLVGDVERYKDPSSGNLHLKFTSMNHNYDINICVNRIPASNTFKIADFDTGEIILYDKFHACVIGPTSISKSKFLKNFVLNQLNKKK